MPPAAAAAAATTAAAGPAPTATEISRKPALVQQTGGATSKIIHPEQDISLEERRSQLPRYRQPQARPPAAPHPAMMAAQGPPMQMGMMRPGGLQQPLMMGRPPMATGQPPRPY
ncbi:BUB3-interacting and GLEBS motif-containing protein ZNF207-like isoform X2 [Pollicipes pollicipes]|uniref:BUB3-interacting and GLEBS motif-containing protein ZNF207-like isoform X2 n=1 Tax=Pollicipes pollicipes TaxID=41117 RepID=UPI0018853686|nr:BUB3-interacting and GLEBS motif-containing protein ZNF207-like isoform X2 [Pollicipes pollicipes]